MIKFLQIALVLLVLSGCATHVSRPSLSQPVATLSAQTAQAAWARVLEQFVNEQGEVDFVALNANRGDLDTYLNFIATSPARALVSKPHRLAHLINSYNALSMFNVLHLGIPESNASLSAKATFFFLQKYEIGGEFLSLYAFENEVIRKEGEPRIHWALNCSAVSCPTLPRTPFTAENIEVELEREARNFFNSEKHIRVDPTNKQIWLSEIFWLFPEDFVPAAAVSFSAYAQRYTNVRLPDGYAERKIPYDWTIANSSRPR